MTDYNIEVNNCNSIENAKIVLSNGTLNIKYGPNGIGKSSVAKAISSAVRADGSLQDLKPFKYRSTKDKNNPSVSGIDDIKSVLIFDDSYVSQFLFQQDEVVRNSFEIFINTETYRTAMIEIDELFKGIKAAFDGNEELSTAISDLREVRDAFSVTKAGAISKSSKGFKAFGSGNKVANIPPALKPFEDFIKSEQPASWIAWQSKGNAFLDLSENCPYCSSSLQEPAKKETARLVAKEYDSKAVEHLNALQAIIERLGKYFQKSTRDSLERITRSKIELSPEEINFLAGLRGDVDTLLAKLEGLRAISFFSLRDVNEIESEIGRLKIDLDLLKHMESEATKSVVVPINEQLQALMKRVGELKGKINTHKQRIESAIKDNQGSVNKFLKAAGYRYSVQIIPENDSYKMKLRHEDFDEHIGAATQHLSYGERNAFALVLFMHQVRKEKPDLVILDDPVSSFDKTKKFAIINELFRGQASLRDITVLMLTHDIEPAIDVIRSVKRLFQHPKPTAFFLHAKNGLVTETKIEAEDIQTFAQICSENIVESGDDIVRCIYLRRHFELINDRGLEYNYLANLLHGREVPVMRSASGDVEMTNDEIARAVEGIKRLLPSFDYSSILSVLCDKKETEQRFQSAGAGYEKLQIFRIYRELHITPGQYDDSNLQKLVNESFHIENEYVMQLNPRKFDNVPEYIVDECSRIVSEVAAQ